MKQSIAKALFISIPFVGLAPDMTHAERVDLGWRVYVVTEMRRDNRGK